jgi:demethylmenaquinone methyltransferase / 2-methoxy-6-polyprenyl-1,4-benzoquinol methylase
MGQDAGGAPNRFAQELFTPLPARYDRLAELLSLGQNARWRREMVARCLEDRPGRVLDVACGTAGVSKLLASGSTARVVGLDLTEAMIRRGVQEVARAGLSPRISLVIGQGERLPFPDRSFDALTFTYLLRYVANPAATLVELARVLKPGGRAASLEFYVPPSAFWRAWWWLYTRGLLPLAGGLLGGREWYHVGRFLGPNITGHYRRYPLRWTEAAWRAAGFDGVGARVMSLGGGVVMWGRRVSDESPTGQPDGQGVGQLVGRGGTGE